jgi:hypothetical protein
MKMLLASRDFLALLPVAKRLVAAGIPIALCKAIGLWSYLEVWIQRDSDFGAARSLLPAGAGRAATAPGAAKGFCAGCASCQQAGGFKVDEAITNIS